MRTPCYHVTLSTRRTTVSLDETLAALMALKLGQPPHTPAAHTAIRTWLQARLDENNDAGRVRVSQWLQQEAILFLVDKKLSEQYGDWLLSG